MRAHLASISMALGLMHGGAAMAAETAWTDVTVRVYDTTQLAPLELRSALDRAAAPLGAAGVNVTWRVCGACDAPMGRRELAIRIVRSPWPSKHPSGESLGDALVDVHTGEGVLGTLYLDRVQWLADTAGTRVSTLLGHAIAHELGHLLLLTRAHSKYGLMRAVWSRQEIQRGVARDWAFTKVDVAAIQRRAATFRLKAEATGE